MKRYEEDYSDFKNNSAYLAMKKGKGEIVVSHASDEAILIASAFSLVPKQCW